MMEIFWNKLFFSNSIKSYLVVIGVIFLVFIFKKYVSRYVALIIFNMLKRSSIILKKQKFIALVVKPIEFFILLMVAYIAIDTLKYPKEFSFSIFNYSAQQILNSIINSALVIVFIWMCIRIIDFAALVLEEKANLTKDNTDNQLIIFFKDFFKALLVIIGILLILKFAFNKNIATLLTGLSIVGAAIALATRESLENLIASFIIFFDKPFTYGDTVKVQNITGTVEKIGLRSTRLRTDAKTYVSVPNKQMVDSIIDNLSLRSFRKGESNVDFILSTSLHQLQNYQQQIEQFLRSNELITNFDILLVETGKDAHKINIEYFTSMDVSLHDFNLLKQKVNYKIIEIAQKMELQFFAMSFSK